MSFVALTSLRLLFKQHRRKFRPMTVLSFSKLSFKKQALYDEYHSKIHLLLAHQKRQIEMLEYVYGISEGEIVGGVHNDEYFCEFYDRYSLYLHNDDIQDEFIKDFCSFQTSTYLDSLDLRDKYLLLINSPPTKKIKRFNKFKKPFPFKL